MVSMDSKTIEVYGIDGNKVYYPGAGKRENFYEIEDRTFVQSIAERISGIACLMPKDRLIPTRRGYQIFGEHLPLAPGEPHADEPTAGFGTAFLISLRGKRKYILTAGHCVEEGQLTRAIERRFKRGVRVVFGFQKTAADQTVYDIPRRDVYKIKRIVNHTYTADGLDFALIKLKKSVVGRAPLPLDLESDAPVDTSVYMLGHGELELSDVVITNKIFLTKSITLSKTNRSNLHSSIVKEIPLCNLLERTSANQSTSMSFFLPLLPCMCIA